MLISIFKSNQKLVNGIVLLLTMVLWLPAFFIELEIELPRLITTELKWVDISMAILLIVGQSVYLNIIVNEYKLLKENSYLTSLMLMIFNSGNLFLLNLNQVIIANSFILIAFHQLLRMYKLKNNYVILFNAAFLTGIASLIYLPCIIYFVLIWITLSYTTTPKWRDFIISLLGLSIPLIYYFTYKFVFGSLNEFKISNNELAIFKVDWVDLSLFQQVFFALIITIFLPAFMGFLSSLNKSVVRVRKMLIVVILMFIIGLATLIVNGVDYLATFLMVSIPLAIISANFFQNIKRRWLAELICLSLLTILTLSYFS